MIIIMQDGNVVMKNYEIIVKNDIFSSQQFYMLFKNLQISLVIFYIKYNDFVKLIIVYKTYSKHNL